MDQHSASDTGQSGQQPAFQLSETALERITELLKDEPAQTRLRISVTGGGCSGFQYQFDFDAESPEEDDIVICQQDAEVIIDTASLDLLKGSMLDYVETLGSAAFEIKNPNATAACGCGNSFSVM